MRKCYSRWLAKTYVKVEIKAYQDIYFMLNNATEKEGGQAPSLQNIQMSILYTLAVPNNSECFL